MTDTIDDFEDGDIITASGDWDGWSGDTGSFSADNTTVLAGSFSGLLDSNTSISTVNTVRTAGGTTQSITALVRIETLLADANDDVTLGISDGANFIGEIRFGMASTDNLDVIGNSTTDIGSWTQAATHEVTFDFDPANNEFYVEFEGTRNGPFAAINAFSTVDTVIFENDTVDTGTANEARIDNVIQQPVLNAPSLSVDDTRGTEIDLSVSSYPGSADEIDIYRSESSPVTTGDTLVTTLTDPTTTFTDTGLENGERYYYAGIASDSTGGRADSSLSAEVDGTTTLPAPTINNIDADSNSEISFDWTLNDNSSDGDITILVNTVFLSTLANGTTSYQAVGLTEATRYEFQVRRNTDHTSATSAVAAHYTEPNAPTNLTATPNSGTTTVSLSWDDNSLGEDGYEILTQRDGGGQTQIASEPADTTSYTTSKVDRISTNEYQIRAFAGSGSERASSLSNTDTATFETFDNYWCTVTPPGGSTETFTAPHVSYVDLEHTAIHGAGVVLGNIDADIATWGPKTDIEIFLDDERIFAGEIIRLREDTPTEGQTDITAKGPVKELENAGPTSEVTYSDTLAYLAIEDYFNNQITGIDVNATVYAPPENTVENDTLLLSADITGYASFTTTDLTDVPITAAGSYLIEETAFIGTSPGIANGSTTFTDSDGSPPYHIAQRFERLDSSLTSVQYTVSPEYDIPSERVGVAMHGDPNDIAVGDITDYPLIFNGVTIDELPFLDDGNRWSIYPNAYDNNGGADLSAGNNYNLEFEFNNSDAEYDIDALVVYDTGFVGGTFADITTFQETLDNPVPYNPVEIDIENEARPNAVKSGRVDSTVSNIGGDFQHRVSVTGEASDLTSSNADDTFDFFTNSQYGTIFEPFLQLDGEGSNSVFSSGVNAQEVTQLDYYLTTVDTEVIEDVSLTGSHYDNLRQLHQIAGFYYVTDPRFDPDIDGINIESFLPGSSDSQKAQSWTTIDVDVEREFDGYANAVTVVYEDTNGDTQTFVGTADSSEVASVGATVRKVIFDPSVNTIDEARIASEREKRRRIANDTTSGDIEAVASFTLPGYSYNITEFGGYTTLAGRVSYRESADDVTMDLKFKADKDNVQRLLDTQEELEQVEKS